VANDGRNSAVGDMESFSSWTYDCPERKIQSRQCDLPTAKEAEAMMEALKCPQCRKDMVADEKFFFWKCPSCKGEWWPDDDEYQKAKERIQAEKERERLRCSVGGSITIANPLIGDQLKGKGASGSSKSRSRKKKKKVVKRKLPWMLE